MSKQPLPQQYDNKYTRAYHQINQRFRRLALEAEVPYPLAGNSNIDTFCDILSVIKFIVADKISISGTMLQIAFDEIFVAQVDFGGEFELHVIDTFDEIENLIKSFPFLNLVKRDDEEKTFICVFDDSAYNAITTAISRVIRITDI